LKGYIISWLAKENKNHLSLVLLRSCLTGDGKVAVISYICVHKFYTQVIYDADFQTWDNFWIVVNYLHAFIISLPLCRLFSKTV
jgi:hypothetical protein